MIFLNKKVFQKVVSVFSLAIIIISFVSIYFLGILQGYSIGRSEAEEQFISRLEQLYSDKRGNPTSTPIPTPRPVTMEAVNKTTVSWGGPELWGAVNAKRVELGVNPLSQRDELCTTASIRLNELLELGKLDGHEGFSNLKERRPDLAWIFERYSTIAEFLAVGGESPEETVSLWENTLGHKKLLTGGEYVWGCIYAQNTFAVAITAF